MFSCSIRNRSCRLPYKEALMPRLKKAHEKLQTGSGLGGEFTGWVHLPRDYDRAEFARIQAAAATDPQRLPGPGGHRHRRVSYLGARGRHRLPLLPQLQPEKERHAQHLLCRQRPRRRRAAARCWIWCGTWTSPSTSSPNPAPPRSLPWRSASSGKRWRRSTARRVPSSRIYATTDKAQGALKSLADAAGLGNLCGAGQRRRPVLRAHRRGPAAHRRGRCGHRRR